MDHMTLMVADCVLVITMLTIGRRDYAQVWSATCTDLISGKVATATWTKGQVEAVTCLMICGEDNPSVIYERLYLTAENAIEGWPVECRPIP
jgi:hypothetical protein